MNENHITERFENIPLMDFTQCHIQRRNMKRTPAVLNYAPISKKKPNKKEMEIFQFIDTSKQKRLKSEENKLFFSPPNVYPFRRLFMHLLSPRQTFYFNRS